MSTDYQPNQQPSEDLLRRQYCIEKAIEAFKYNQDTPVLELAKQIEDYLSPAAG